MPESTEPKREIEHYFDEKQLQENLARYKPSEPIHNASKSSKEGEMPKSVQDAVTAIWISIALGILDTLIEKFTGKISAELFMFTLIMYGIAVMFPYKISRGNNPARYVWTIFFAIGILAAIGGVTPKISGVILILLGLANFTITSLSIYWLFTKEADIWFNKKSSNGT